MQPARIETIPIAILPPEDSEFFESSLVASSWVTDAVGAGVDSFHSWKKHIQGSITSAIFIGQPAGGNLKYGVLVGLNNRESQEIRYFSGFKNCSCTYVSAVFVYTRGSFQVEAHQMQEPDITRTHLIVGKKSFSIITVS